MPFQKQKQAKSSRKRPKREASSDSFQSAQSEDTSNDLPSGWVAHTSCTGLTKYHSEKTGKTTWKDPRGKSPEKKKVRRSMRAFSDSD